MRFKYIILNIFKMYSKTEYILNASIVKCSFFPLLFEIYSSPASPQRRTDVDLP